MKTVQLHLNSPADSLNFDKLAGLIPDLILAFGSPEFFENPAIFSSLKAQYPNALLTGCSTAGEISGQTVSDNQCSLTCIQFSNTQCKTFSTQLENMADSFAAGERLGLGLAHENLRAVFVLGPGVNINGSALINGLSARLPPLTPISGGLAADNGKFTETWTLGPEGASNQQVTLIAFYGENVLFSYGTFGGWEPFGPTRKVTASNGNILLELDGEPALDIYKRYLGDYAKDLPGSGLLFPFEMLDSQVHRQGIFRTILGVNEDDKSLTLAGDVDPDGFMRLMHANSEKLIDGAEEAARLAFDGHKLSPENSLAILVSCIGRKLVMGDRIDEEVEAVASVLGNGARITGYYSNGEIAGSEFAGDCKLHNQTMTITWISEKD